MIEHASGDILKSDEEALVNPIDRVGVMELGIAQSRKTPRPRTRCTIATRRGR